MQIQSVDWLFYTVGHWQLNKQLLLELYKKLVSCSQGCIEIYPIFIYIFYFATLMYENFSSAWRKQIQPRHD